eukprot:10711249-Alexandrium_andersonii.AAC.1
MPRVQARPPPSLPCWASESSLAQASWGFERIAGTSAEPLVMRLLACELVGVVYFVALFNCRGSRAPSLGMAMGGVSSSPKTME